MSFINKVMAYKPRDLTPHISPDAYLPVVIILLIVSNIFMSMAWYHHLKHPNMAFIMALGVSLIYIIFEYTANIHANAIGHEKYDLYTLKIIQEAITLSVFMAYAFIVFGDKPRLKHLGAFGMIMGAVVLALN